MGGLANGLTGFGTAMTGFPFWLAALEPIPAAQLASACSVVGQLLTARQIWDSIDWVKARPMLLAGFLGLPLGLYLLPIIPVRPFKIAIGGFILAFALMMLLANGRWTITRGGAGADRVVAFIAGAFGGLASLSGGPITMWSSLKGWSKEHRRGIFQIFNFSILTAMLLGSAALGRMSVSLLPLFLVALPATVIGVITGHAIYRRLDDRGFDRIVLSLLVVAGLVLVISNA
jgi:uncharacterized protein